MEHILVIISFTPFAGPHMRVTRYLARRAEQQNRLEASCRTTKLPLSSKYCSALLDQIFVSWFMRQSCGDNLIPTSRYKKPHVLSSFCSFGPTAQTSTYQSCNSSNLPCSFPWHLLHAPRPLSSLGSMRLHNVLQLAHVNPQSQALVAPDIHVFLCPVIRSSLELWVDFTEISLAFETHSWSFVILVSIVVAAVISYLSGLLNN